MFTLPFVVAVTGMLVAGYSLLFCPSAFARASGVSFVVIAALITGGLVTGHLNGGKPYGLDVPGIERWKEDLPPPAPEAPQQERGPAIA